MIRPPFLACPPPPTRQSSVWSLRQSCAFWGKALRQAAWMADPGDRLDASKSIKMAEISSDPYFGVPWDPRTWVTGSQPDCPLPPGVFKKKPVPSVVALARRSWRRTGAPACGSTGCPTSGTSPSGARRPPSPALGALLWILAMFPCWGVVVWLRMWLKSPAPPLAPKTGEGAPKVCAVWGD